MSALLRDSALGQLIRLVMKKKVLLYPEERPNFQAPSHYCRAAGQATKAMSIPDTLAESPANEEKPPLNSMRSIEQPTPTEAPVHRPESIEEPSPPPTPATEKDIELTAVTTVRTGLSRVDTRVTMEKIQTRRDLEQAYSTATLEKGPTHPIIPETLDDGTILVDWYDTDDPENPQNWSVAKKNFVTFQIW